MRKLFIGSTAALLLATAGAGRAVAGNFDVDFGLAYSQLRIDGNGAKDLDKSDGAAARASFMFPQPAVPGLKLGFGLEVSGYRNDFHEVDNDGDNRRRYHELDLVIPELRAAYTIPFGNFFVEPGIGVGLALADYRLDTVRHHHHNDDDFAQDDDDTFRANVAVHPSLKIGYGQGHWAAGLEAGYMFTHLHFGDGVGGDVSELYGGAFFRWSF